MQKHCQNPRCDRLSNHEVPVSVGGPSDQKRSLCDICHAVFEWGVQHGRMTRKPRKFWVLAIADRGMVVQGSVFCSRRKAVEGLATYLKTHEDYDGAADMPEISEWLAEHDERLGVDIFPAPLNGLDEGPCSGDATDEPRMQGGLVIDRPPHEAGSEPLYRVVYTIDVSAPNARQAAEAAYEIMTDPQSLPPVLDILDVEGSLIVADLVNEPPRMKVDPKSNASLEKARRFVQTAGTQCPACGGERLYFAPVEVEAQSAFRSARCHECEAIFYAIYRLVGYGQRHEGSSEVHTIDADFGDVTGQSG